MTIFQVQLPHEEINATRICSFLTELTEKNKVKVVRLEQICVENKVSNLELRRDGRRHGVVGASPVAVKREEILFRI